MTDRKSHWNDVYRNRRPDEVSWYQSEPTLSLQLIERCGTQPDQALIDIGGGTSTLVDCLQSRGFSNLTVLDVAAAALNVSQQRLGAAAELITWLEADVTKFVAPQQFAFWHDRAVFHFLTQPTDQAAYFESMAAHLTPDGNAVIATFALEGPRQCSGLDIVRYGPEQMTKLLAHRYQIIETVTEHHLTPGGQEQVFNYFLIGRA